MSAPAAAAAGTAAPSSAPAAAASSSSAAASSSPAAPSSSSSSFRPTFANLLGANTILDDGVRALSEFLYAHLSIPDVELEGKLGMIFHKRRNARIHIDGISSLVLVDMDDLEAAFSAEVDANVFRHVAEDLLQRRYTDDVAKARAHQARPFWRYAHTHSTDRFHTVGAEQVRVSYDQQGQVTECIVKEKLKHMDFFNGRKDAIDFRISASRERTVPLPTTSCWQVRRKDRLSYLFDLVAVELTRVDLFTSVTPEGEPIPSIPGEPARPAKTTFEIEVELKELDYMRRELAKFKAGAPNEFVRSAQAFFDSLRTLSQFSFPAAYPANWKHAPPTAAQLAAQAAQAAAQAQAAAAAEAARVAQSNKRRRMEEEQATEIVRQEYGKTWS